MECKDEAAVERQKLVPDDEIENDPDDEQTGLPSAPGIAKTQTPISPVLSSKVFVVLLLFGAIGAVRPILHMV